MIRALSLIGMAMLAATLPAWQPAADRNDAPEAVRLVIPPLSASAFVPNAGQWPERILFAARTGDVIVAVERDRVALQFTAAAEDGTRPPRAQRMDLWLPGASEEWTVAAATVLPGHVNFLKGRDPGAWTTRVPLHGAIELRSEMSDDRWTVRLPATGSGIEFTREAGSASWSREGFPTGVRDGAVIRRELLGQELIETETATGFSFDWAAFITGNHVEEANDAAFTDDDGVVVVGRTTSVDFFTTIGSGPHQHGVDDAFVVKFDALTAELRYSTVVGGPGGDIAAVVRAAADGDVALAGQAGAGGFPTTPGAYSSGFPGSGQFVARLKSDGTALVASTQFGNTVNAKLTVIDDLVVEADGSVIIVGYTDFPGLPVTPGAFQPELHPPPLAGRDGFVLRFSADLSAVLMCTYFGGGGAFGPIDANGSDWIRSVFVCRDGSILIGGGAAQGDFPITPGAFDPTPSVGPWNPSKPDGFVAKLSSDGTTLLASTYIGFNHEDQVYGVAEDPLGRIVVVGATESSDFPTTPDAFQPVSPDAGGFIKRDGYVLVLSSDLTTLEYGSFIGSCCLDHVRDVHVDGSGVVTMFGVTEGTFDFPITVGSYGAPWGRGFLLRLHPDLDRLLYSAKVGAGSDGIIFGPQGGMSVHPVGSAAAGFRTSGMNAAGVVRTPFPLPELLPGGFQPASGLLSVVTMLPAGVSRYGTAQTTERGPVAMGVLSMPYPGNAAFGVTVTQGPDSTQGLLLLSQSPLPTPLSASGADVWLDPTCLIGLLPIATDGRGWSELRLAIPPDPSLVDFTVYAQSFWRASGLAPSSSWQSSNALRITVQPAP